MPMELKSVESFSMKLYPNSIDLWKKGKFIPFQMRLLSPIPQEHCSSSFNFNNKCDFQLFFEEYSKIVEVDNDETISSHKYDSSYFRFSFTKLNAIQAVENGTQIDVIAIVQEIRSKERVYMRTGEEKYKISMRIFDDTRVSIEMTIWSTNEEDLRGFLEGQVICLKDYKVHEYKGTKELLNNFSSKVYKDCGKMKEGKKLLDWAKNSKKNEENGYLIPESIVPISYGGECGEEEEGICFKPRATYDYKTLEQIEEQCKQELKRINDRVFNDTISFVYFIRPENLYYLSCTNEKCNRKVFEVNGRYKCESCQNVSTYARPRFVISARLVDSSPSNLWITIYDSSGKAFIGLSADEVKKLKEGGLEQRVQEVLRESQFVEYRLRLQSKMEFFNGEMRVKHSVLKIYSDEKFSKENKTLKEDISLYLNENID